MSISLENVGHSFGPDSQLFRNINLTIQPGEVWALVGPSGSGKSTLLSIISGWLKPSEGSITRLPSSYIYWVFQNPYGVAKRDARDHVVLPLLAQGHSRIVAEKQSDDILERFNLGGIGKKPFAALSGGEAQRLMLARGVACKPDIFLVDEPTAQLDMHTADTVNATLGALSDSGAVVLIATHDARTRDACQQVLDLGDYL